MTYSIINRNETPLCFHSRIQFNAWKKMARLSPPIMQNWICTDCTEEYQKEMLTQKRCVQPNAKFANKEGKAMWITQENFNRMEERRIAKERKQAAIVHAKRMEKETKQAMKVSQRAREVMRGIQRAAKGEI